MEDLIVSRCNAITYGILCSFFSSRRRMNNENYILYSWLMSGEASFLFLCILIISCILFSPHYDSEALCFELSRKSDAFCVCSKLLKMMLFSTRRWHNLYSDIANWQVLTEKVSQKIREDIFFIYNIYKYINLLDILIVRNRLARYWFDSFSKRQRVYIVL